MDKEIYVYRADGSLKYSSKTTYLRNGSVGRVTEKKDFRTDKEKLEDEANSEGTQIINYGREMKKRRKEEKRRIKRIRKEDKKYFKSKHSKLVELIQNRRNERRVYKEIKKLNIDYNER